MTRARERNWSLAELVELFAEAEFEVRRRLRRQPDLKPQFGRGVQSGLRWLRDALSARLGVPGEELLPVPDEAFT